jgi:hypothetical protein
MAPRTELLNPVGLGWADAVAYGMRGDGSVAVAQRFSVIGQSRRLDHDAVWVDVDGQPVQLRFRHLYDHSGARSEVKLVRIAVPLHRDGRLGAVRTWQPPDEGGLHAIETYVYEDGRIVAIDEQRDASGGTRRRHLTLTYGPDGELGRIDAESAPAPGLEGGRRVVYVAADAETTAAAVREAEIALAEAITRWATHVVPPDQTARCLVIAYVWAPDPVLPPYLALGTDSDAAMERALLSLDLVDFFALGAQAVVDSQPSELVDGDPRLEDLFAILNQHWRQANHDAPGRFLDAVARRLAGLDWAALLPQVSPTFAVVAVPLEDEGEWDVHIDASVPAGIREHLIPAAS